MILRRNLLGRRRASARGSGRHLFRAREHACTAQRAACNSRARDINFYRSRSALSVRPSVCLDHHRRRHHLAVSANQSQTLSRTACGFDHPRTPQLRIRLRLANWKGRAAARASRYNIG